MLAGRVAPHAKTGAASRAARERESMPDVNIWAVLVAALTSFMLGGAWYGKALFGEVWNREAGRGEKKPPETKSGDGHHPTGVYVVSFLFALLAAYVFAIYLGHTTVLDGLERGFLVGACVVAASFGINYMFAGRSWTMWLIDGGYHTVQFTIYGLILGAWH
jgi:hypothetical protein